MHGDVIPLTFWALALCVAGCLWAHVPIKKSVFIHVLIPVIVFGFAPLLFFAVGFILVFVEYLFLKLGFEIEDYAFIIAFVIKSVLFAYMAWIFFSNERLEYLQKAASKKSSR